MRGGKRAGAGRQPNLTPIEELEVGAACEQRWLAIIEASITTVQAEYFLKSDYIQQMATVNSTPIEDRSAYLQSSAFEQHQDDVEFARREMTGMAPDDPALAPVVVTLSAKRPKGPRAKILKEIAEATTQRLGKPITLRTIETAWKRYRSLRTRLINDDQV